MAHGRIGTWPGSLAESLAKGKFPEAKIVYFETVADMAQNLRQNKIEAFAMNRLFVDELLASGQDDVEILVNDLGKTSFAFVFADSEQGKRLCSEFNEFLKKNQENGELFAWHKKWLSGDKDSSVMEKIELTGEKGTLNVVTNPVFPRWFICRTMRYQVSRRSFSCASAPLMAMDSSTQWLLSRQPWPG